MRSSPPSVRICIDSCVSIRRVVQGLPDPRAAFDAAGETRGQQLLEARRRVQAAARMKGKQYAGQPQLPPDVLGGSILLPTVM